MSPIELEVKNMSDINIESLSKSEKRLLVDAIYCDIHECIDGLCEKWNRINIAK